MRVPSAPARRAALAGGLVVALLTATAPASADAPPA